MKNNITVSIIIFLALLGATGIALGRGTYKAAFLENYKQLAGSKLENTCNLCHTAGPGTPRNPFGVMVETTVASGAPDFASIEGFDADGDGYTNIEEINGKTFPGDSSDHPDSTKYSKTITFFGSQSLKGVARDYCIVDGKVVDLKTQGGAPYIKGGKMMVPLRIGIEQLGAEVVWDAKEKRIDIKKKGLILGQMWIGKRMGNIKGKEYDLVTPPEIVGGKTFVPVKGVGDALDAVLVYVDKGKIATFGIKAEPKKSCCEGD